MYCSPPGINTTSYIYFSEFHILPIPLADICVEEGHLGIPLAKAKMLYRAVYIQLFPTLTLSATGIMTAHSFFCTLVSAMIPGTPGPSPNTLSTKLSLHPIPGTPGPSPNTLSTKLSLHPYQEPLAQAPIHYPLSYRFIPTGNPWPKPQYTIH